MDSVRVHFLVTLSPHFLIVYMFIGIGSALCSFLVGYHYGKSNSNSSSSDSDCCGAISDYGT